MSSSNSDYSEDYEEEYDYSEVIFTQLSAQLWF
jgi:hypothetical protein